MHCMEVVRESSFQMFSVLLLLPWVAVVIERRFCSRIWYAFDGNGSELQDYIKLLKLRVHRRRYALFCCVRNFFKNPECFWFLAFSACHFLSEKMSHTARHAKSIRPEDPWTICLRSKCVLQTCGKSNQIVLCCGGDGMCRSCTSKYKV